MTQMPEGNAIVYCEGEFGTPTGKTAHGLVRKTRRYCVLSVLDSTEAGKDAGQILDGQGRGIPVHATLEEAFSYCESKGNRLTHFVVGIATDGGRMREKDRQAILKAISFRLNIDSGLHDFLSDDPSIASAARTYGVTLRDIRKTPPRSELHSVTGKISEIGALRIAVLGTDAAIGKRTTAWKIVDALNDIQIPSEMIGTGQTAWLQGATYSIRLDALINDFVAGELEHACWTAWQEKKPRVLVIEGQGGLMNPSYPGGLEILAACRPNAIVLQHAPGRKHYEGLSGAEIHPLKTQIQALELISGIPVIAVTINHERLEKSEIPRIVKDVSQSIGLPSVDVLTQPIDVLIGAICRLMPR